MDSNGIFNERIKQKIMTKKQIKKLANDLLKYKDIYVSSYTTKEFPETVVPHKDIVNTIYSHIANTLSKMNEKENQNRQ